MYKEIYLQYGYRRWYASPECATESSDQTGSVDRSVTGRGIGMTTKSLYDEWRNQIETFSVLLAICAGNSSVTRAWTSKQSRRRWFETPLRSLLRRVLAYNGMFIICSSVLFTEYAKLVTPDLQVF